MAVRRPLCQAAYQFPLRLFPALWLTVTATQNELYAPRFMPAFQGWPLVLFLSRRGNWIDRKPSSSPYFGPKDVHCRSRLWLLFSPYAPLLTSTFSFWYARCNCTQGINKLIIIIQCNVRWRIRNLPRHQWQLFNQPIDLLIVRDPLSQWIES